MAKKISELPVASALSDSDLFEVVQDGANKKMAGALLKFSDPNKVDKVAGKQLSSEDFTTLEKTKLAGLDSNHFRGAFATLAALQAAVPVAKVGDYAFVDPASGTDVIQYLWDDNDSKWIYNGRTAGITAAQVKTLYEGNPNTNAYTDAEKTKLGSVADGAQVNAVTSVAGRTGAVGLGKNDVGLGSVDNTADNLKPVSAAQASAIAAAVGTTALAAGVAWNSITSPGRYYIPGSTDANVPLGAVGTNWFLDVSAASNVVKQMAKQQGSALSLDRALVGSAWGAWDLIYNRASILGLVSQSGGTPTGAIISNVLDTPTGIRIIKWADGTCWAIGNVSSTAIGSNAVASASVTFPTGTFTSTQSLVANCGPSTSQDWYGFTYGNTTTAGAQIFARNGATAQTFSTSYIVVGRWY